MGTGTTLTWSLLVAAVATLGLLALPAARALRRRRSSALRARARSLRAQAMYEAMFERNLAIKLVVDATSGAIVDANSAAVRFYGYEREQLLALNLGDLSSLSPDALARELDAALHGRRHDFNVRHRLASGELRDVEVYSGPMVADGRPLLFSIVHDVTARRRVEQTLEHTVSTLRGVLDNAQVAIVATTEEGVITHFNPGAERLLGWSSAEMLGLTPLAFHDPDEIASRSKDGLAHFGGLVAFEPGATSIEQEWTWIDRWGHRRPVRLVVRRVSPEGGSSGYVGVAVDLTALRVEAAERRELGLRLEKLAAQIPGAVFQFRLHPDGRQEFPYVSPGVESLLGFPAHELMADWKRLEDVVVPDDLKGLRATVYTGTGVFRVRRGGQERWLLALASPEREPDGCLVLHGFVTDITEQKRTEAQLEQAREEALAASRVKSDFLANMSHEIRTPLNGILGLTQLVLETRLDASQRESLETVLKSGNSLLTLLNDILDLTRVESGLLTLESMPFRVSALLSEVTAVVGPAAAEKDLEVLVEVEPGVPPSLLGDPTRLRQVLTNLLGNAVKFTSAGWVSLTVSPKEGGVCFTVQDTGIGIPPEKQDGLFEVFTQVDASVTRRFGGSGLGLAISRRLVERMGGTVALSSEPGEGTRFRVELPLVAPAVPESSSSGPRPETPARVLVVSQVVPLRESLARTLRRLGAEVLAAEALDLSGPLPAGVDVVLVDTRMPAGLGSVQTRNPGVRVVQLASVTHAADPVPGVLRLNRPFLPATLDAVLLSRLGPAPDQVPAEQAGLPRLSVLVAEDNVINAKVVTTLLRRDGHWVVHVTDGRAAVAAFSSSRFDLVLMDVQMPELDGLAATRAIRAQERALGDTRRVPIIALTASAMKGDIERCLDAGMDAFLAKPLNLNALRELIVGTQSRAA
jgi:two-component system, sensor histidine kinase and response regulator